ncbi:tail fiber domain-containing protein [Sulfitobacter aestuariivivens]|uniref:Tail fiber domain-containing protein n=1 Tax=Sulfitobacter aestuariivivens TaxID=2766981 RepID=A0A927HFH1_9RHOB|nr:tail fiber domain-containing protein [Sulfitobacter aestuariivivens]MBD3664931.1 tail fiber domain-containing protein [Sulfitobacter aestuariivivens]
MTKLKERMLRNTAFAAGALAISASAAFADQVFFDDVIVDGSLCVGLDCVNGEVFGFNTIIMKENNTRLRALDTSASSGFPTTDWVLLFNESANGGANKFSVQDLDAPSLIFTLEGGAPADSLYVDDGGRVGFGTASPVVELHAVDGDTPTLRLEQDGSSGFSSQTWDVAGNETNFFVRDVTNSSTLPFRIRPTAPTSSIDIAGDGDVGIGTASPSEALHVLRTNGSAKVLIEENSGTEAARGLLEMRNNGTTFFSLVDESAGGETWNIQSNSGEFRFTNATGPGVELAMTTAGDMTISGSLTQNSDKHAKMAIVPVDPYTILQKVAELPVSSWTYKDNAELGIRHIGPMAQDFYAAFGTGASDTGISSLDTSGVALAAIKALASENAELKSRLASLEQKLAD